MEYPIWGRFGFVTIPALLAADAAGDTITLPYILAHQVYEWVKTKRPTRSASSPHNNDIPRSQADEK